MIPSERIPEMIGSRAVRSLVEAQAIRSATVLGQPGGWVVLVRYGGLERAVASTRRQLRTWRHLNSAAAFVQGELGLARFEVDASGHEEAVGHRRPDQAERLRRQREAADHDAWFRAEVEEAIREADDPNTAWIPHEVVKQDMARQRAALLAQIKGEAE